MPPIALLAYRRDAASFEQGKGHDRNFPELDIEQFAISRLRIAFRAHGAKADGEPVERTVGDQCAHIAHARHVERQPPAHIKPFAVLADGFPNAQRLMREMLIEHAHLFRRPLAQRRRERAGCHDIARAVGLAEQRGIAFELIAAEICETRRRARTRKAPPRVGDGGHVFRYSPSPPRPTRSARGRGPRW